jgi:hypothetical protein
MQTCPAGPYQQQPCWLLHKWVWLWGDMYSTGPGQHSLCGGEVASTVCMALCRSAPVCKRLIYPAMRAFFYLWMAWIDKPGEPGCAQPLHSPSHVGSLRSPS